MAHYFVELDVEEWVPTEAERIRVSYDDAGRVITIEYEMPTTGQANG